jgi:hypothetical protein
MCLQLCTRSQRVSRVYNVAGILWLQFVLQALLFPIINVSYFHIIILLLLLLLILADPYSREV